MRIFLIFSLFLSTLTAMGFLANADEIVYNCKGLYNSKTAYDEYDPSSVSVRAQLNAVMLSDESVNGEYTMLKVKLVIRVTNHNNENAGSFDITEPIAGKFDKARNPKFQNYIKFNLGIPKSISVPNDGDIPMTYILIPKGDLNNIVYVQRQYTGHNVYPTIALKCAE